MSVSIKKTGIVQASGEIGANLLPHTNTVTYGLGYLTTYSSGTVEVDNTFLFNGKPTIKVKPSSSSTSSGGFNAYNSNSVSLTKDVQYCYSCWVYTDVADNWNRSSLGHFQTYTSSAAHNCTLQFDNNPVSANTWTPVHILFTPTVNCAFRSFHIYFANTSQTLWLADVKLEEGSVPTLWTPNINDTEYVDSFSGFNEYTGFSQITKGTVNATDFIEI